MQDPKFIRFIFRDEPSDLLTKKPADLLLTVRQGCEQNNFSFHAYNYWKRILKEEVVDQMDIKSITSLQKNATILKMQIARSIPEDLLQNL